MGVGESNTQLCTGANYHDDTHNGNNYVRSIPIVFFCLVLSSAILLNLETLENVKSPTHIEHKKIGTEICAFDKLREMRLNNPKRVLVGHLNINSIPNKFDGIMDMVGGKLDIFLISETKINPSFPNAQFCYKGYGNPYRKDRSLGAGGGLLLYVNENIPSRKLNAHSVPADIEIICVELNLRKQKWIIIGIYRPPKMNEKYFYDQLSRVVDLYSKTYDRIVIMGDFNSEPNEDYIDTFSSSYNLYNLVKEKTCFKGEPKCYDLIYTNCKHNFQNTTAMTTGFSDFHKMTVTVLKTEFVKADPLKINYRDYKTYNLNEFNVDLKTKLSRQPLSNTDYNMFQNILNDVLEKHAPLKTKYLRGNNSAFMTKYLRKMIMNRSRSKNAYFKHKTVENWENYRKLRNDCVKATKKAKKAYFEKLNINSVNDNKSFWRTVKPFFTDNNKKSEKIILVENSEIVTDNKINAEIMNEYFVNITNNLDIPEFITEVLPGKAVYMDSIDEIIHKYSKHPSICKIKEIVKPSEEFLFSQVDEVIIEQEILKLNGKKSAGPDTIPPKVIKDSIKVIKPQLTKLFNTSVTENCFPSNLKYGNISPIFKKGDNTKKENYRPISILPSISKIFERLMFQQTTSFISNFLSPYLCGFRKGYNAQHALLRLKNILNQSLDRNEKVGLLMMDLSKAFDCIPHELLIAKLNAYGFSKRSLKLIFSYLKGRHQRVKINSEYSSWKEILDGVPQGSVLGPLLFNIFINDLFLFVQNSEVCNYADDNTLSVADTNVSTIIGKLENDIEHLRSWFKSNGMLLNGDKCQFLLIESSRATRSDTAKIKIGDNYIEESKKGKLLGINFDNNLTMDDHIKCLCKQASNKLYALARISPFLNEHKRKILMKSFILSQFNYCPLIWMYCKRKSNNLINRIHERALRIAYNDYVSDFNSLLRKENTVTIHQRNIQALTAEIYKTLNDLNPPLMKEVFCVKKHNIFTRKQNLTYPNPRTVSYGIETFGYKASQIWRNIPSDIQQIEDIFIFKKNITNYCENICNCNICKQYVTNLGYIDFNIA